MIVKTKRQLILDDFLKTLKELRETKSCEIEKKPVAIDFTTLPLDAYFIIPGVSTRLQGSIGKETYYWEIDVECYTKDDPEQKIKQVYNKMLEDKLRNNNTDETILEDFEYWCVEEKQNIWGIAFTFSVIYSHTKGSM